MRNAFVANMLRGVDSSGVAQVNMNTNLYDYHKLLVSGNYFIQDSFSNSILTKASSEKTLTMGHVRAATVGKVNISNAHPFAVEQEVEGEANRILIGMHNGTLTNWRSHKNSKYYDVDSEWALNHIAEEGLDAFEEFKGAFCFTWWDSDKPTTLNIARNSERPMYVVMLTTGGMAYASEAGMLYWLLERNKVAMDGPILELEAGFWYKFDVEDPADFDKVKLPSTAYKYTATYTPPKPTPPAATVVGKVNALLAKVKTSVSASTDLVPASNVTVLAKRDSKVSMVEYKAAKDMGLLGQTAIFTPYMEWADGIEGKAVVLEGEVTATVRSYDTRFSEEDKWECRVIGVQDDEKEIVIILSPPVKADAAETVH